MFDYFGFDWFGFGFVGCCVDDVEVFFGIVGVGLDL